MQYKHNPLSWHLVLSKGGLATVCPWSCKVVPPESAVSVISDNPHYIHPVFIVLLGNLVIYFSKATILPNVCILL